MIISGGFNVTRWKLKMLSTVWLKCRIAPSLVSPTLVGEAIKAVIVLQDGSSLEADTVIALCKEKLGSMKAPKSVDFWDALPFEPGGQDS